MNQHNPDSDVFSKRRAQSRLESVLSIFIIIILMGISAVLIAKQSNFDLSRFGMTASDQQLVQQLPSETKSDFVLNSPADFDKFSEMEIYSEDNLYEKIDGKAPLYTEAGFQKLYCQRFASQKDPNIWMEIFVYDMGTGKNAFSVYSMQTRADAKFLKDLQGYGYATSNGLYFAAGKFYTEMIGSAESPLLVKAMIQTSKNIGKNTNAADSKMEELDLLPKENLVPGSEKLYIKNAFGFEGLSDIITAGYSIDGKTVTAFISKQTNAKTAETMAESYRKFLTENGATAKQTTHELLKNKIFDFYGVTELVFAKGQFVIGIHEGENQNLAEKTAIMISEKLSEKK